MRIEELKYVAPAIEIVEIDEQAIICESNPNGDINPMTVDGEDGESLFG